MLTRLARWWLARRERPVDAGDGGEVHVWVPWGECTAPGCGLEVHGEDLHVVGYLSTDDELLGIEGQTALSADYCATHCPGGCLRGCVPSTT